MIPIGRQIAEARHRKGMTQDEVARQMNLSRQALSHWEQGRNLPDVESLRRLSRILGCSFDLGGDEAEAEPPVPDPAPAAAPADVPPPPLSESRKNRSRAWLLLPAALLAALAAFLLLRRAPAPAGAPPTVSPTLDRASVIRIESGEAILPNEDDNSFAARDLPPSGRTAEIRIESEDPIPPTEDDGFVTGVGWIFTIYLQETGGAAFDVDTISVEFYDDRGMIDSLSYDPASIWAGTRRIPALGRRKVSGGVCLPGVNRLSVFLSGTDETGSERAFSRDVRLLQYGETETANR